jgi:hypothetical protein
LRQFIIAPDKLSCNVESVAFWPTTGMVRGPASVLVPVAQMSFVAVVALVLFAVS